MEERNCIKPSQSREHTLTIDQKASEKKTNKRKRKLDQQARGEYEYSNDALEQHNKSSDQTRHADARERNRQPENHAGGGQIEQDQREQELPEAGDGGYEPDESVNNASEHQRWHETQRKDIK